LAFKLWVQKLNILKRTKTKKKLGRYKYIMYP